MEGDGDLPEGLPEQEPGTRRAWVVALRDRLPLPPHGHDFTLHRAEDCPGLARCEDGSLCGGTHVRFTQHETRDWQMDVAVSATAERLREMGVPGGTEQPPHHFTTHATVMTVVMPAEAGVEIFREGLRTAQRMVDAYRIGSDASVPPLSPERLVGPSFTLVRNEGGSWEHETLGPDYVLAHFARQVPMDDDDLRSADDWLFAAYNQHPVVLYRELKLRAKTAHDDGDHTVAVILRATAAEVLIEQVARCLTWEQSERDATVGWTVIPRKPVAMYPLDWIGNVLEQALGGAWEGSEPVRRWREDLARVRNRAVHEGSLLDHDESDAAHWGLVGLEEHVSDALARRAQSFPRTALLFCGEAGLRKRGALGTVRATLRDDPSGTESLRAYRAWDGPQVRRKKQSSAPRDGESPGALP